MFKLHSKIFIATILLFTLGSFSLVHAVVPIPPQGQETNGQAQESTKQGCENIEARIKEKTAKFNSNRRAHVMAYNNMLDRVKKFVEKLKSKGYDTTKLQGDAKVLNSKIIKFGNDYTSYINKLSEAQNYACSKTWEEFSAKFEEAKKALKIVREDVVDIKNYYQNVIRKDISDIKNQPSPSPKSS